MTRARLAPALAAVAMAMATACGGSVATHADPDDAGADAPAPADDGGGDDGGGDARGDDATRGDAAEGGPDAAADGACPIPPPVQHRPVPVTCDSTRPPGINTGDGGVGPCNSDSQCTDDAGTNGRCTPTSSGFGPRCTYDTCTTDTDCQAAAICVCGAPAPGPGRYANTCIPGGCKVDSDCPGGWCSPTFFECNGALSISGYYCHGPCDSCTDNSQCPSSNGVPGYCEWDPQVGQWACAISFCAG